MSATTRRPRRRSGHAVSEARDLIVRLEVRCDRSATRLKKSARSETCSVSSARLADAVATTRLAKKSRPVPRQPSAMAGLAEYEALRTRHERLKTETDAELSRYREEIRSLQMEMSKTTVTSAREQALRQAAEDRLSNLQRTYELTKTDLEDTSKRAAQLQEILTRREVSVQMLEEQLIQSQSSLDQLRTQVSSLQAEKAIWKSSESKLLEEISAYAGRAKQLARTLFERLKRCSLSSSNVAETPSLASSRTSRGSLRSTKISVPTRR